MLQGIRILLCSRRYLPEEEEERRLQAAVIRHETVIFIHTRGNSGLPALGRSCVRGDIRHSEGRLAAAQGTAQLPGLCHYQLSERYGRYHPVAVRRVVSGDHTGSAAGLYGSAVSEYLGVRFSGLYRPDPSGLSDLSDFGQLV